jgi:hypothetical protein
MYSHQHTVTVVCVVEVEVESRWSYGAQLYSMRQVSTFTGSFLLISAKHSELRFYAFSPSL